MIVFLLVLALTVCSYLAYRDRHGTIQKKQQVQDDALVHLAREVVDIGKGVRTALEERMVSPPISHLPPASSTPAQQETSLPASAWNVPYVRNPFFTEREELLNISEVAQEPHEVLLVSLLHDARRSLGCHCSLT